MAQLIKLADYISRYEANIYQYPTRFIRLKKENWSEMESLFKQGKLESKEEPEPEKITVPKSGWKRLLSKVKTTGHEDIEISNKVDSYVPQTLLELKQYFLDGLYPFQLKWASTTLREKSFVDDGYKQDRILKYFLQRFPDNYFLMYRPIVEMKKAKVEADHLLIGPTGIDIIYYLDVPNANVVYPTNENSWYVEQEGIRSKILSPLLSLKRTETFVRSVLNMYDINIPYRIVVLAPNLSFSGMQEPFQTDFIGTEKYSTWFEEKRRVVSPLKHIQLKVADALIRHSLTTSVKRPEWDVEENPTEQ